MVQKNFPHTVPIRLYGQFLEHMGLLRYNLVCLVDFNVSNVVYGVIGHAEVNRAKKIPIPYLSRSMADSWNTCVGFCIIWCVLSILMI